MPLTREKVRTDKAPAPMSLHTQAMRCGDMVFVSGHTGLDPVTSTLVEGTAGDRARRSILNLQAVLEAAGSGLDKIVKVRIIQNFHPIKQLMI